MEFLSNLDIDQIVESRKPYQYPELAHEYVNMLLIKSIHCKNDAHIYGSVSQRIQPRYGDIDTLNKLTFNVHRDEAKMIFINQIQKIITRIIKSGKIFFTDAKFGLYKDGTAIHWTYNEIMKGKRNGKIPDFNGHIGEKSLFDALDDEGLIKIDIVAPYLTGKYIEVTMVYNIKCLDGFIGSPDQTTDDLIRGLKQNATIQYKKGKLYKVVKRIFAISRLERNYDVLKKLAPILESNISKISLINNDLNTIQLLVELDKKLNIKLVINEIEIQIDQLASVIDIPVNQEFIDYMLRYLEIAFKTNDRKLVLELLNLITGKLSEYINTATASYLKKIGWNSIPTEYLK